MVIPVSDRYRPRATPWVNRFLLFANVAVFVFLTPWWADGCTQAAFYLEWATIPAEVGAMEPLDADEAARAVPSGCEVSESPDKIVPLSLLTSMFLHGGWLHLLGNMIYLGVFGGSLEDRLGHLRYLTFYLLTGTVASLVFVVAALGSTRPLVGASGAIAAVLGAYFRLFPKGWVRVVVPWLFFLPLSLPAVVVIGLWFALELVQLQVGALTGGNVATLAHVAGFVTGLALVGLWRPGRRRRSRQGR
jgi:membrane associated rhomboid family serine protease